MATLGTGSSDRTRRRVRRAAFLLLSAAASAGVGSVVTATVSFSLPSPALMRAEIVSAFGQLGTTPSSAKALAPYVQGADAALIAAIANGASAAGNSSVQFVPDKLTVSSINQHGTVATVAFSAANGYGPYPFVGTAVYDGGRWKVSWVTVCMLIEQEGALCPDPPAGVNAPAPLPYSVSERAHVAGQTPDLLDPQSLALAHDGSLLIVDSSRNQVLRLASSGTLSVFAGDGRTGFSGDGGPAIDAELDLQYGAGMAVAPNGSVYIADPGNCRLRAVSSDGTIRTVAHDPALCNLGGVTVSRAGVVYVTTQGYVDQLSPDGALTKVAGAKGEIVIADRGRLTPHSIVFSPVSIAFDGAGNLDIWSFEPREIYRLTPQGEINAVGGFEYATEIASSPGGSVFVATHGGPIDRVTATGIELYNALLPRKITGLGWSVGFQPDGIAVSSSGDIYVDNDPGNGYGNGTALVELEPNGSAHVVAVRTPLLDTLPPIGAPGFPSSIYPAAQPASGSDLFACPSSEGLEPFNAATTAAAAAIAKEFNSSFSSDLEYSDRAWWQGDFELLETDNVGGEHTVLLSQPAAKDSLSATVIAACGDQVVNDSLVVDIGQSAYGDEVSHLYFLDRRGRALVYFQAS